MTITPTAIPAVLILEPKVFADTRGEFFESYNQQRFDDAAGVSARFVQDNHSVSSRHVLRGLHYQVQQAQGKLLRVVHGEIFDVAVDLRRASPTFGHWAGVVLSAENRRQLWVPEGFAHGFLTLSERAELLYKTTDYYAPQAERTILWNDPAIGIEWPASDRVVLSPRDASGTHLADAEVFE